jgi:DnaJ-domain-containing protein 1
MESYKSVLDQFNGAYFFGQYGEGYQSMNGDKNMDRMKLITILMVLGTDRNKKGSHSIKGIFRRFRKGKVTDENVKTELPEPVFEPDIGSEFRVTNDTSEPVPKKEPEVIPEKIYQPGISSSQDDAQPYEPDIVKPEDLNRYDVEVKELPEPEEEEIDVSWIDLDVNREFKYIIKELEGKKVSCYEILGTPRNASPKMIHKAYRKLAAQYHPDKGGSKIGMTDEELMERIREINYSKEILLDPTMRALHDQMIRDREKNFGGIVDNPQETVDLSLLKFFKEDTGSSPEINEVVEELVIEKDGSENLGVIFFRKWEEELENFSQEFLDYIIQLDDGGYIDFGQVIMGDISDMDELVRMRKISNYSQAVNNSLFDVWVLPPFYYMAIPVLSREYIQEISSMLKESFGMESIFFSYPRA